MVFDRLDLSLKIRRADYEREIKALQNRLHLLGYQVYLNRLPVVIVFEGPDAAGKGGAIKRLTQNIDPRGVRRLADRRAARRRPRAALPLPLLAASPRGGQIAIFDRSWYGRVLVERVEGYCTPEAWARAYPEINQFERQLVGHGTTVVKLWIHISKEEQLKRFRERERLHYKSWKLTQEDWRNRGKWEDHLQAADEMILKTSTHHAPWVIVEANDKLHARVKVLRTVERALREGLARGGAPVPDRPAHDCPSG